jgi:hypothetical protein
LKKKESAAKSKELPELKRPDGRIADLQKAMGLEDDRALYISCHVSVFITVLYIANSLYCRQLFVMSWHQLGYQSIRFGKSKNR